MGSGAQEGLSRKTTSGSWPAVQGLTGKIQSAGVERQLWVGNLRRKAIGAAYDFDLPARHHSLAEINGKTRIYTITVQCKDASGNAPTKTRR
jgi:hypothetical protein